VAKSKHYRRVEVFIYTIHINIGVCSVTVVKNSDSVRVTG